MNLSVGIVGLPNVGKSTLFNALTNAKVEAQNYPFCTIEPNKGIVEVADERLSELAKIASSKRIVPAIIEFVDIAGLVKGASKGEGLGNQFLGTIREVAAIAQVIRNFEDTDVIHVEGSVDANRDMEVIEMELILKDIESVEKKVSSIQRFAKTDAKIKAVVDHLEGLLEHLGNSSLAYKYPIDEEIEVLKTRNELFLLTDKPFIYIINTKDVDSENGEGLDIDKDQMLPLDIKLEYELSELSSDEKAEYLSEFGLSETGLQKLSRECYDTLDLISFFTAGEMEARAWTIKKGHTAPQAAGVIHTDFEKNFIAAEVVSFSDFKECGGWLGAKDAGKVRLEGKNYIINEGDVVLFKHN